jgi:hypothetical protein
LVKQIKPNFKIGTFWKRYGFDFQRDTGFFSGNINQLESNGTIDYFRKSITLTMEDVEISSKILKDGWLLIQTE